MPDPNAGRADSRLTVIEVLRCWGADGTWTVLELWYWFHGDQAPKRFRMHVDKHPPVELGDLIMRNPTVPRYLSWWTNKGHRRSGFLLLVGPVEEVPPPLRGKKRWTD